MDYKLEKFDFKPEILQKIIQNNILLYFVVLLLVLKITATLISINIPQNIFFADITKSALESFANQTRQSMGLPALTENQKLNQAAQLKAENMVQNQYFSHTSPSGVTPWFWFLKAGYNYKYAGENLAIGFYDSKEVYDAWLNSPSHRANILSPNYTEVGTAVLNGFGQNDTIVVVQEFGSLLPVKTIAKNNNPKPAQIQPETKVNPTPTLTPTINTNQEVLSQAIKSANTKVDNITSGLISFVLYNYDSLLQNIIYGVSLVVIGILLALIFFNFNVNFKKQLVFRAVLIVVLLSLATLLNKEIIISFIPHQIII